MMGITFKSFNSVVGLVTAVRKPVLLRSRHGMGKSTIVYEYAEEAGLPMIERRASQMSEGDLLGLPKLENGKTEWVPPAWLKDCCDSPHVLFIDELDRATTEVRQGFFELTDSRKVAGWNLHEDTLIFAAVNGGESSEQYQVGEMDPAELDRWTVFDLEPSIEDWLTWGKKKNNIDPMICNFIGQNQKHLEHIGDFEPGKVYPSRRSWHRFSECVSAAGLLEPGKTNAKLAVLSQAFLGFEASMAFTDFVRTYSRQVSPKDILDEGKIHLTEKFDINEYSALCENIAIYLQNLKEKGEAPSPEHYENLAEYFVTLPSEVAIFFWRQIGRLSPEGAVALHKAKNGLVQKYIVEAYAEKNQTKGEIA